MLYSWLSGARSESVANCCRSSWQIDGASTQKGFASGEPSRLRAHRPSRVARSWGSTHAITAAAAVAAVTVSNALRMRAGASPGARRFSWVASAVAAMSTPICQLARAPNESGCPVTRIAMWAKTCANRAQRPAPFTGLNKREIQGLSVRPSLASDSQRRPANWMDSGVEPAKIAACPVRDCSTVWAPPHALVAAFRGPTAARNSYFGSEVDGGHGQHNNRGLNLPNPREMDTPGPAGGDRIYCCFAELDRQAKWMRHE